MPHPCWRQVGELAKVIRGVGCSCALPAAGYLKFYVAIWLTISQSLSNITKKIINYSLGHSPPRNILCPTPKNSYGGSQLSYSCYRGTNAQVWPLWAAGTEVVHKHTCRQNIHAYNYKNIKIYMTCINVYQAVFWRFNWNVKIILTQLFSIWKLSGNDSDNSHMENHGVRVIPRVQTSRAPLKQICLQFLRQMKTTNDTFLQ